MYTKDYSDFISNDIFHLIFVRKIQIVGSKNNYEKALNIKFNFEIEKMAINLGLLIVFVFQL